MEVAAVDLAAVGKTEQALRIEPDAIRFFTRCVVLIGMTKGALALQVIRSRCGLGQSGYHDASPVTTLPERLTDRVQNLGDRRDAFEGMRDLAAEGYSAERALTRRGLRGVKLVISDAHEGLKSAAARVLNATWQRCRVHFMRNLLAHAGKSGRRVVAAFVATAFAQEDAQTAKTQWRQVADQLRPKAPKLANLMDQAEPDVLAYMTFPKEHRTKLHSTNTIERLNGEIKRRTNVVGIFPNEAAITRLIGAILLEQNDDWAVQRARYMTLESITPSGHDDLIRLPQTAA